MSKPFYSKIEEEDAIRDSARRRNGDSKPSLIGILITNYLKGLDVLVRVVGAHILVGLLYFALWGAIQVLIRFLFGVELADRVFFILSVVLAPIVFRFGILAAGFTIPPFRKKKD